MDLQKSKSVHKCTIFISNSNTSVSYIILRESRDKTGTVCICLNIRSSRSFKNQKSLAIISDNNNNNWLPWLFDIGCMAIFPLALSYVEMTKKLMMS